jgi:hypothetical protein
MKSFLKLNEHSYAPCLSLMMALTNFVQNSSSDKVVVTDVNNANTAYEFTKKEWGKDVFFIVSIARKPSDR